MKDVSRHLHEWLILHLAPGIGPGPCLRLVEHFGGPGQVLAAGEAALTRVPAIRRETIAALTALDRQAMVKRAAEELALARRRSIHIIPWDDEEYPPLLRTIPNPPPVLYVIGLRKSLHAPGLAVVGSRAATDYGKSIAAKLAFTMARHGFTIISGLALGIDACAHQGAINGNGRTIAVLGCGLDIIYPRENRALFKAIPTAGAIVSEYPFGTKPDGFRFPARNRIISGLALGVLVVEASSRSGSLITANHALEQGREVFAVPGRVDSLKSSGAHTLLQQGAKLVMSVNDIIEELPAASGMGIGPCAPEATTESPAKAVHLEGDEDKLFSLLEVYPKNIDEIVHETGLPPQKVSELLLLLELKDLVEALPGKNFKRNVPF